VTALERLGQPKQPLSLDQVVDTLCRSTLVHRPGYEDKTGNVVRGNVEVAVLTAGMLDLPLIRALDYVYIVNNVPQLYAATMRIVARREGYDLDFPDAEQSEECGTAYIRYGERGAWRKATFTREQAAKAGLLGKDNWKYQRDMLTERACTRAIKRYAPEVLAGMSAAGVWSDTDDDAAPDDIRGGSTAPSGATIPPAEREPALDPAERDEIVSQVLDLDQPELNWFRTRWKHDLGAPNLTRGWLSAAHGALLRYMLEDAEEAAIMRRRLEPEATDEPIPADAHDDDDTPEALDHDAHKYDPDDPGRPFTDDDLPA
jgi:hypothetical protein